ncbi:MAG: metallophosphoesterase [Pseudomonadota bacterium]|nr:metallophosphoesterase [Pseudomonadota bacterium]
MLIAHITDSHLGLPVGFLPGHPGPAEMLRRALAHVRALQPAPDVLLLSGDLAEAGREADYLELQSLLRQLLPAQADGGPLLLCVPGNHDLPATARRVLGAAMPVAPDAPAGRMCVRAAHGGLHFIGLETVVPRQPHGALDAPQLDWLATQLHALAGQPVLLFMHHPPLVTGIEAMDAYGLRQGTAELARLVAAHGGVQLIACGHMHRPIAGALGGAPVVVAPSPSHQLALDLRPGAPLAIRLEPPMIGLYRWTPQDGIACHFSHVQAFDGPYPV